MESLDLVATLTRMRETEVLKRRGAIAKWDMAGLKEAQTNIDIIDRAMADEASTVRDRAINAAARRGRQGPDRDGVEREI